MGVRGLPQCPVVEGAPGWLAGRRWWRKRWQRSGSGGGGAVSAKWVSVGLWRGVVAEAAGAEWERAAAGESRRRGRHEEDEQMRDAGGGEKKLRERR